MHAKIIPAVSYPPSVIATLEIIPKGIRRKSNPEISFPILEPRMSGRQSCPKTITTI